MVTQSADVAASSGRVVTLGETLGLVAVVDVGPLRMGAAARLSFAGAESNMAVGLARLGHSVTWIGRVGDDEVGRLIATQLRAEQVEARVVVDASATTALMTRHRRTADRTAVKYWRAGSAGSRLSWSDVPADAFAGADLLHITGITPALSTSAADAVVRAVARAREVDVTVSMDVNYRSALWSTADAAAALRPLAEQAQLVFGGPAELELVGGEASLLAAGVSEVVVKDGAAGASVRTAAGFWAAPAVAVTVVEPVGAGDAFVAGYLSARLDGLDVDVRLARGATAGAFCVSTAGDWEGLPTRSELGLLIPGGDDVSR